MARKNWDVDSLEQLLFELEQRGKLSKLDIAEIATLFGATEGSIRSMLPRIKRALNGKGCLSEATRHKTITNIREAYRNLCSEPLPQMTYCNTNYSTGHKKGSGNGKPRHNDSHNFSSLFLDKKMNDIMNYNTVADDGDPSCGRFSSDHIVIDLNPEIDLGSGNFIRGCVDYVKRKIRNVLKYFK